MRKHPSVRALDRACFACRIRFELQEDGNLQRAAQLIIASNKLLHARRLPEVTALLAAAQEQQRAAAKPQPPDPPQPDMPVDACRSISQQDRQLLQAQQQQHLTAGATSPTQVVPVTARLEQLESYLVGALFTSQCFFFDPWLCLLIHCHAPGVGVVGGARGGGGW